MVVLAKPSANMQRVEKPLSPGGISRSRLVVMQKRN